MKRSQDRQPRQAVRAGRGVKYAAPPQTKKPEPCTPTEEEDDEDSIERYRLMLERGGKPCSEKEWSEGTPLETVIEEMKEAAIRARKQKQREAAKRRSKEKRQKQ